MILFGCIFLLSVFTTFLGTVFSIKLAKKTSFVDVPKKRNIHKEPIPILGGLAILLGILINGLLVTVPLGYYPIIFGMIGIFLIGIIDDKLSLKPLMKIGCQSFIVTYLFLSGIKVEFLTFPLNTSALFLSPLISFFVTQAWFIIVINMFNLIDGVDGLAAGISLITASILFIVSLSVSPIFISFLLISIIGSTLSFLKFNFYPAKIFLGDSGSLLLGYLFAAVSIVGVMKSTMSFIMLGFIFALPLMDLILSIFRRLILRKNIFKPDLLHIHHQLVRRGLSTPKAVFILYFISAVFGGIAILISQSRYLLILYVLATIALIAVFGYFNYLQLSTKRFKSSKRKG